MTLLNVKTYWIFTDFYLNLKNLFSIFLTDLIYDEPTPKQIPQIPIKLYFKYLPKTALRLHSTPKF